MLKILFTHSFCLGFANHACQTNKLLNKLALYLYKSELCFKVIERKYNMAAHENFGHWFDCHKQKIYAKV